MYKYFQVIHEKTKKIALNFPSILGKKKKIAMNVSAFGRRYWKTHPHHHIIQQINAEKFSKALLSDLEIPKIGQKFKNK